MDNVIENRDAQNLFGLSDPIGDLDILSAWFWVNRASINTLDSTGFRQTKYPSRLTKW